MAKKRIKKDVNVGTIVMWFAIGLFIFSIFLSAFDSDSSDESSNSTADGFTIEGFDLKMDVSKDNVVSVQEDITVDFYESGHHGIYRFVPTWLEYTDKNGNTVKRKSSIDNLKSSSDSYTVDEVGEDKFRIKLGSASYTLTTGRKKYEITYDYNMGNDPFEDGDAFIFHAYGDFWGTSINNATLEIKMPDEFDSSNVSFYADKYRKKNITNYVDYEVKNNTLYASVDSSYKLNSALTVEIDLPEGYFDEVESVYTNEAIGGYIIVIFIAIIIFILWLFFGKDREKYAQTVEFYPPDDMDPVQIGYIYGGQTTKKMVVSLIINLASKGYITISKELKVSKALDITGCKPLTENEKIVYGYLFEKADSCYIKECTNLYRSFDEVGKNVKKELHHVLDDKVSDFVTIISNILKWIALFIAFIAYFVIEDLDPTYNYVYIFVIASLVLSFVLSHFMDRMTVKGEQLTARVLGFKNYLETAEKAELQARVEQDPKFYYKILPYAYILDVSKVWVSKFEDIQMPVVDMGTFNYNDIDIYTSINDSVTYPVSSSSGGSSCGGGCSSCGGGCSSCGGGGSW